MSSSGTITLTIDDREVTVPATKTLYDAVTQKENIVPTTIYDAAQKLGINIPILCHREHMNPIAVCRACVVNVGSKNPDGSIWWGRVLAPACYRAVEPGMVVQTSAKSDKVKNAVKCVTELLMSDHPSPCAKHQIGKDCELEVLAAQVGVTPQNVRFRKDPERRTHDDTSLIIAVDHNACILCDRCIRGCDDIRNNHIIGRMGKGYKAQIAFDLNDPMGKSHCVSCGECMVSCPTGALTNRGAVQPEAWGNQTPRPTTVSANELINHPKFAQLFEGVSHPFLRYNDGAVVRRSFKKGDIICREGDSGSTAFLIERGKVEIFITSPMTHVKNQRSNKANSRGLFSRFTSVLVGRSQDAREEEGQDRYINIDAPVSLSYANPIATLQEGDLFGEMSCMNNYPRSATVRAAEDVTVLEMLRNVLYILQRSNKSKAYLDRMYRERAVDNHLRSVPIFASLLKDEGQFQKFVDFLRPRVELVRLAPGEVVFRQGDKADDFYLVRTGFIKVWQTRRGEEQVLTYKGPGTYFGEIGLMSDIPEIKQLAPEGVRTATCSALDHVDLVRVKGEDFQQILNDFPQVKKHFIELAIQILKDNDRSFKEAQDQTLGEFLRQGLMNAQSLLVLDLQKCTRCDECTKACSDAHEGVTRLIRDGLRFDRWLVASSCRSCLDPYCMVGCPVDSIHRRNSREMIIEDWCIGCGNCANNCPYGNINMHPVETMRDDPTQPGRKVAVVQEKATMCDLCTGLDSIPSCVYACPHDAAHRMSGTELKNLVTK
jgi:CRP-like cAMP-binding protein/Fe-S-cluster-containing hydrogenase component 2